MTTLSEDELLAVIRRILSRQPRGVLIAPGDDAAVVELDGATAVLTADMMVERVHFDGDWFSPEDLGYKSVAVNVSDVAAMGGIPRFAVVSLGLPPRIDEAWVNRLYSGMLEAGKRYGVAAVGGDISRSDVTVIAVTIVGEVERDGAITRGGAQPGDVVVVTGTLGGAAGGLEVLRRTRGRRAKAGGVKVHWAAGTQGEHDDGRAEAAVSTWGRRLLERHFRPPARLEEGRILARAGATAMMDLSDGLAKDLGRLCRESHVGADVRLGDIPIDPDLPHLERMMQVDPLGLALEGGEDMELLATLPPRAVGRAAEELEKRARTRLSVVGSIREGQGLRGVEPDGSVRPLDERGWDHFAS